MGMFKPATNSGRSRPGQPSPSNTIRGRISGPIPIDDEFPIRNPGSSMAHEGHPARLETPTKADHSISPGNTPPEVAREDKADSLSHSGPSQTSYNSSSPNQRRTNRSSTLRYSTVSDSTDVSRPQRKKSTLKSALGKLFGRKRKDTRQPSISEDPFGGPENHHRSDPSAVNRQLSKENEPKRSASLPITEFDRALRSHSVGPDDIIAITSARNSIQADPGFSRRRAETASRVQSVRVKDFGGELIGLSPRPASTHGRGSQPNLGEDDPDNIGRAVTSDIFTHRRRSRSLSQLPDVSECHTPVRKRSDEIRYWRASYDPGYLSPNLSASNHGDGGMVDTVDEEIPADSPVAPNTPPQPFNFGPISNMRITEAASLEDRLANLEVHTQKLEKLVSKLFHVIPGVNNYVDTPERVRSSQRPSAIYTTSFATAMERLDPSTRCTTSRESNESFGDGNTFIGSVPQSTRTIPRPTSDATVRGATSLPTLPRDNSEAFSADQYTTLLALLDAERTARQALEAQVTKLSRKVDILSRASPRIDTSPAYNVYSNVSAFDHDDDDELETPGTNSESEAFRTPREERPSHGFGAFGEELRDEEEDGSRKKAARTLSLSQLTLGKPKPPSQAPANVNL
ncbi:hypothetical protein F4809DRAFT_440945 [Biscogniauxia mediterranea]|nr:hypothetical protein F4809DRAFT_440945 [Biscogniauxia mediterranea]